jgi:hypothetical protein
MARNDNPPEADGLGGKGVGITPCTLYPTPYSLCPILLVLDADEGGGLNGAEERQGNVPLYTGTGGVLGL